MDDNSLVITLIALPFIAVFIFFGGYKAGEAHQKTVQAKLIQASGVCELCVPNNGITF